MHDRIEQPNPSSNPGLGHDQHGVTDGAARGNGIVVDLGTLPDAALLNEEALARMLSRSRKSVKRAVQRGELPQPVRLMGQPSWTAGAIRRHFEARLAEAAKAAERRLRRIDGLRPAAGAA